MQYLHTMLRVRDLDKAVEFYTKVLGFRQMCRDDYPSGRFTLCFLQASGDSNNGPMLELTHNWDTDDYDNSNAYGHLAYKVDSIEEIGHKLAEFGTEFSWGPGETPSRDRRMAFLNDPDGYAIELLQDLA
jgi:lactoylglutathione lyase